MANGSKSKARNALPGTAVGQPLAAQIKKTKLHLYTACQNHLELSRCTRRGSRQDLNNHCHEAPAIRSA